MITPMSDVDANAGRIADTRPLGLVEVRFRQPARLSHIAAAGAMPAQIVAAVIDGLGAESGDLTALHDQDDRCWIVFAPSGLRLARIGGMSAPAFNQALAALDAAAFERIAA